MLSKWDKFELFVFFACLIVVALDVYVWRP
jgi:hypothetical protein